MTYNQTYNQNMKLQHYPADTLKSQILEIAGHHLDLNRHKLFFFGSRTTGKGSDRSDIDIGILGQKPVPLSKMADIETALENLPLLYKIEVVDFVRVSEKFKEVALQKIEPIN